MMLSFIFGVIGNKNGVLPCTSDDDDTMYSSSPESEKTLPPTIRGIELLRKIVSLLLQATPRPG